MYRWLLDSPVEPESTGLPSLVARHLVHLSASVPFEQPVPSAYLAYLVFVMLLLFVNAAAAQV